MVNTLGQLENFSINSDTTTYGVPFNFYSIMFYPFNAYARRDTSPTIVPLIEVVLLSLALFHRLLHDFSSQGIEPSDVRKSRLPSRTDVDKVRRMYNCQRPGEKRIKCT